MTLIHDDFSQVVLVVTPSANDGDVAVQVLGNYDIKAIVCEGNDALARYNLQDFGAVIISEEALTYEAIDIVQASLKKQETWSDIPIILLTNADVITATEIFSQSGNISLLERPFSELTLIRSVEVALKARLKQYEVRDLLAALQRSKDDAERANLAKTEFLANMSHEIRTPIGAIMGFIDLIKNSDASPENQAKYMGIIDRNSQQLLRLIDDILDLSKVEAGKMTIEHLSFRLNEFLADFISNMNFKAAEKGLQFNVTLESAIPDRIITDPVRLRQILSNVVGNAIKFTDKGHIDMKISYQAPFINFIVKDTGIGLSKEQALKLFKPFTQADSSTTRKFGGTGLGLVLSRKLAETLGGGLHLESSTPNQGSSFVIQILPEVPSDARLLGSQELKFAANKKDDVDMNQALKGLNILLVEDSPDNQFLIETYLQKTGARISIKSNGLDGSEAALKEDFDLILMDVQMPVMDGHEATQKLRRLKYSKPIIALTAHAMNEEKMKCFASGFNEYLTKPLQKGILLDVLKRYMPK